MQVEPEFIEAEVYHAQADQEHFFVKVTFVGMGMFINSFTVRPSKFEDQTWWVQPPKHRQGKGWTATVDFDKSYPTWGIIEQKVAEAVELYKNSSPPVTPSQKDEVVDVDLDKPITLDDIKFPF